MILRALCDLAAREALVSDPDFPLVPVAWLVAVADGGKLLGFTDTRIEAATRGKKRKLIAKSFPVPYQAGRSGTKAPPAFFVDNAKYVFGLSTVDKPFPPSEGTQKSAWFRQRIAECVEKTGDAGARAVLTLLQRIGTGDQAISLPSDCRSNDLFAFMYAPDVDTLVHQRPAIQRYWRDMRSTHASSPSPGVALFECIVTGAAVSEPGFFPKVKYVPGGQSAGTPLVAFNASAFTSFGLEKNENAPISRQAAEACATALQRLLHPAFPDPRPDRRGYTMGRRNYRLNDDTVACYWSDSSAADGLLDAFAGFFEPNAEIVGDLYRSVWRGRPILLNDPAAFYALIVSGAQGRMIVRDWFTTSVMHAAENLARHFADLRIVRNARPPKGGTLPEALPLRVLLESIAPLGRQEQTPPSLAAAVFSCALRGTAYPIWVLQRAVERTRAEAGRTEWSDIERRDARAALIKAVLNRRRARQPQPSYPEITVALDTSNTNAGYLCGRLMAVIERLQQLAIQEVNATVVDRFFGAASATPRAVFTRLLRNSRHHARKAREEPTTRATAFWLEKQLDAIALPFDPKHNGFPAFLDLEQQGLFVLGYHQQRHELWRKRDSRGNQTASAVSDEPAAG